MRFDQLRKERRPADGLIGFVLFPFVLVLEGFVTSSVWNWFLTKTFGFQELSIKGAIGLAIFVACLFHERADDRHGLAGTMLTRAAVLIMVYVLGGLLHMVMY